MNVIFVKFGEKYKSSDVNRLASLNTVCNMYCYTDDPKGLDPRITPIEPIRRLNGVWNKLALFSRNFPVQGTFLYVDIDTVVRSLPPLYNPHDSLYLIHNSQKLDLITPTNYDVTINSSVMVYDNTRESIRGIWDYFVGSGLTDYYLRKYCGIDRFIYHEGFETKPHGLSSSYKYDTTHDRSFITYEECYDEYLQKRPEAN